MITKAVLNTGGSRYIGKNPCNLTRLGLLKQMYPDAKFIFIHRDPYQVVESLYRFILSIFPGTQLQDVPADFSREKMVILYEKIISAYLEERKILAPSDLIEIKMDEFLEDKVGHIKKIYEIFDLGDFNKALPGIESYLASNQYVRNESYEADPETITLVNKYASHIVKELSYQKASPIPV
jgi:hypothetical protein